MTNVASRRRGPAVTMFVIRLRLFVGSYAALWLILCLRWSGDGAALPVVMGVLFIIGVADMANLIFWKPKNIEPHSRVVASVRDHGVEVSGYVASYLLPFIASPSPTANDLISYGIFLLVIAVIYARSEMTQINPTLYLMGRRVLRITDDQGFDGHAIVKQDLQPGDTLRAVHLDAGVLVEVA